MLGRLGEAEAGIEDDARRVDSGADRGVEPRRQLARDVADHVVVDGELAASARVARASASRRTAPARRHVASIAGRPARR